MGNFFAVAAKQLLAVFNVFYDAQATPGIAPRSLQDVDLENRDHDIEKGVMVTDSEIERRINHDEEFYLERPSSLYTMLPVSENHPRYSFPRSLIRVMVKAIDRLVSTGGRKGGSPRRALLPVVNGLTSKFIQYRCAYSRLDEISQKSSWTLRYPMTSHISWQRTRHALSWVVDNEEVLQKFLSEPDIAHEWAHFRMDDKEWDEAKVLLQIFNTVDWSIRSLEYYPTAPFCVSAIENLIKDLKKSFVTLPSDSSFSQFMAILLSWAGELSSQAWIYAAITFDPTMNSSDKDFVLSQRWSPSQRAVCHLHVLSVAVQSHYQVCKANGSPMPNPSIVLEEVQDELNELALYLKTETFWYAEKFWKGDAVKKFPILANVALIYLLCPFEVRV
ncbi:hypothetical protein SISNIDRAFT_489245 [Sistotremastrum niveocremeum HHB9708]|uniref:HAT C-terminal dimerisation domain-containing protein n=1 Tax=Sistotremastrum niveocremeum HHB9708 TaxID=1314777 RepID=A0A164QDL9_9AGAM|nr:hypothetical protein SISNIDRAFT_489245 [Sistotremastrum niveocremeum HHB9708]